MSSAPLPDCRDGRPSCRVRCAPFLGVLAINALLGFAVLYQLYKHYSLEQAPMDVPGYMRMVEQGPEATVPPFRYRVLTPLLVRAMDVLPGYPIPIDFTTDAAMRTTFFHFMALNFLLTVLTSAVLFLYLRRRVSDAAAWAGSLFYLFGFFTVTANLIPMTDAACHLAVVAGVLCFDRNRPVAFLLVALAGAFAKETVLLLLGAWVVVHAAGDWKRLAWLGLLVPGALAYIGLTRLYPAPPVHDFYEPGFVLAGLLRVFSPETYSRTFLFHVGLGYLPLLAAFAGWAWLRGKGVRVAVDRGLWVFFGLLWLGVAMGIGNNAGRLAFMAFPAVTLFQARVLEALARRTGS